MGTACSGGSAYALNAACPAAWSGRDGQLLAGPDNQLVGSLAARRHDPCEEHVYARALRNRCMHAFGVHVLQKLHDGYGYHKYGRDGLHWRLHVRIKLLLLRIPQHSCGGVCILMLVFGVCVCGWVL